MKATEIPRYLDTAPTFLIWSFDEILPSLGGLVLGLFIGSPGYCLALGLAIGYVYKRVKRKHPRGYLWHCLYRCGLVRLNSRVFIHPFIRRYLP